MYIFTKCIIINVVACTNAEEHADNENVSVIVHSEIYSAICHHPLCLPTSVTIYGLHAPHAPRCIHISHVVRVYFTTVFITKIISFYML